MAGDVADVLLMLDVDVVVSDDAELINVLCPKPPPLPDTPVIMFRGATCWEEELCNCSRPLPPAMFGIPVAGELVGMGAMNGLYAAAFFAFCSWII